MKTGVSAVFNENISNVKAFQFKVFQMFSIKTSLFYSKCLPLQANTQWTAKGKNPK